jgi:SAM-dependent methyltransferase
VIELLHLSPEQEQRYAGEGDELLAGPVKEAQELFEHLGIAPASNEWLRTMPWKRSLAAALLGDLLRREAPRRRVLEIGGGLSALTLLLARRHDYRLVERATHEPASAYEAVMREVGRDFVTIGDWADVGFDDDFDFVVANDLFPNVDQRLEEFVERFRGRSELRLSLSYYENTLFDVRRVESGERLIVKPWGLRDIRRFVEDLAASGVPLEPGAADELVYRDYRGSLFTNRRNVLLMWMRR